MELLFGFLRPHAGGPADADKPALHCHIRTIDNRTIASADVISEGRMVQAPCLPFYVARHLVRLVSSDFRLNMRKHPWKKCPFSAMTDDLWLVKPIPDLPGDVDEMQVACTEWVWGLKRGGLPYLLAEAHNSLYARHDIADLYSTYQFVLAPTFKLVKEIMDFLEHARVLRRDEEDRSPRRPLTALKPPSGLYRYVFIRFTDAARELQKEFILQPQTSDDLTGWVNTLLGPGFEEGCEVFPIVECYIHPYAACYYADEAFEHNGVRTLEMGQYASAAGDVLEMWKLSTTPARVPQWFIDLPDMEDDDITVASSQALGYTITSQGKNDEDRVKVVYEGDDILLPRVSEWAELVDPESKPEEQPPIRRSERIRRRYHPYGNLAHATYMLDPVRGAPWPTTEDADPLQFPPVWTERSCRFPTHTFSSNDWAFFCYNVGLATPTHCASPALDASGSLSTGLQRIEHPRMGFSTKTQHRNPPAHATASLGA